MKAPAHFHQLRAASLPLISAYHADLLKHDRRIIRRNPDCPFIHVTRDYGSYLSMLIPAEKYPPEGELVPYIFGTADRWHLLKELPGTIEFAEKNHPQALVQYFDGKTLRPITYPQARAILEDYRKAIIEKWREETPAWKRDGFAARLRRQAA
jgi:hypothetical protein